MFRIYLFVLIFIVTPVTFAEPLLGNETYQSVDIVPKKIKAGQFIWKDNVVPFGAAVAFVSIPEQKIYLYRNGALLAISTVSTGKRGYGTPAGVFTVLEKDRYHRSRTYDNAPMPYANRLTWEGVALHAGYLPGHPASHGCIRLPTQFARKLFDVSTLGMTVIIDGYQGQNFKLAHAPPRFPMDSTVNPTDLELSEEFRWQPENAMEGAISIIISEADQHLLVYRNGVEIGRAKISLTLPEKNLGTHAFIMEEGIGSDISPFLNHQWIAMGMNEENVVLNTSYFEHLTIPIEFAKALDSILTPATTLLITDKAMLRPPIVKQQASVQQLRCVRGNCVHGEGVQVYADGSKYIGQFKNGLSEGQGQLILPNGNKYVGTFKNDKFQWE